MSEAAVAIREVIARLEAWAEGENDCLRFGFGLNADVVEGHKNRRDNYMELVRQLSGAVEDITEGQVSAAEPLADFIREHVTVTNVSSEQPTIDEEEQGRLDYEKVSRGVNGVPMSDYMSGWLEGFYSDHPTLQVSLFRNLQSEMRKRYQHGMELQPNGEYRASDGRIPDALATFTMRGYLPLI